MSGRSLRLRLALGGAMAVAVVLTVAALGVAFLFERHATRALGADLDVYVRQLAGGLSVDNNGGLLLAREPTDPRFANPLSGLYWQVTDGQGHQLRSRSLWDVALVIPEKPPTHGTIRHSGITGPKDVPLLLSELELAISDGQTMNPLHIAVASELTRVTAARNDFLRDLAPAIAALAVILIISSYIQISLGLRPLDRIRDGIAAVRRQEAGRFDENIPSEVRPLVEELNALLAVHEQDLRDARDRAADLAHGLKTPLAALRGDAARLRERGDKETADQLDSLGDTMLRHVERELVRARVRGHVALGRSYATAVVPNVRRLVGTLKRTPAGARIAFDIHVADAATIYFDADDLVEVLGNLLENAARHAAGRVAIRAWSGSDSRVAALSIEDDGPGIPADLRSSVLERGRRLDEGSGTGLGLAIVRDIVNEYGWTLKLSESALGGLAVTIAQSGRETPSANN